MKYLSRFCLFFSLILQANIIFSQDLGKEKVTWYNFNWDGDETNAKDAMLLNSKIDSINFNFKWQFDTGSPRTFVYGNAWNSFANAFPSLKNLFPVVDSSMADGFVNMKNNAVRISNKKLPKNMIGFLPNYGDDIEKDVILKNLGASTIIGTMGIDLFRNGVMLIDFKQNKIGYASRLTQEFYNNKMNTISFMLFQNRIILPVKIGSNTFYFFYDSGASLFPLKTTAFFKDSLPAVEYNDTLRNITTWGKSYDVPGGNFKEKLTIGSMEVGFPKVYVHPDPEKYHTDIFKESDTYGLLGNAYFNDKVLVIDFTTMKFSILP